MSNDWQRVLLGDVAEEVTVGFVGSMASEYVDDGVVFLRSQNVLPFRLDLTSAKRITPAFHQRLKKSALAPGDVVTVRTGTPGATAVIPESLSVANCADLVITRAGNSVDPRWLSYYINGAAAGFVSSRLVGAVQQHFNVGAAKEMELLLPSLREQRAIASMLGALDDKIESNRQAILITDELVRSRFNLMFNISQTPNGVPLSDLLGVNSKRRLAKGVKSTYVGMSNLPEFSAEVLSWESREFRSGQRFVNGDVLMARITPCLQNGKTAVVDMLDEGEVGWGSTEYIVLSPAGRFSTPWIYSLVRNEEIREWAIRRMTGSSGRQRFQATGFEEYRVPRPADEALSEFNAFAEPLFSRMTHLRDEIRHLVALRDALIPELLSGRLRLGEAQEVAG